MQSTYTKRLDKIEDSLYVSGYKSVVHLVHSKDEEDGLLSDIKMDTSNIDYVIVRMYVNLEDVKVF